MRLKKNNFNRVKYENKVRIKVAELTPSSAKGLQPFAIDEVEKIISTWALGMPGGYDIERSPAFVAVAKEFDRPRWNRMLLMADFVRGYQIVITVDDAIPYEFLRSRVVEILTGPNSKAPQQEG